MGSNPTTSPQFGQRLLPTLIDQLAKDRPDDLFALVPKSNDLNDGFRDITLRDFATCINSVAFWLEDNLGRSTSFETLAYIGPFDPRYFILALAAAKVGYKVLLPSPRNNVEATRSLFEKTECQTLIAPAETRVDHFLTESGPRHLVLESLPDLLSKGNTPSYPYSKTYEEADHDPFVIIHTSGSTGLPKPVTLYHGGLAVVDRQQNLPPYNGRVPKVQVFGKGDRTLCVMPPFHMAGLWELANTVYFEQISVWPPAGQPPSADLVDDLLSSVQVDICFLPPSIWEELSQSQASLERLRKLKFGGFGGGPLAQTAGDKISQFTKLLNMIGSSESAIWPTYTTDAEDWNYLHYDPELKGLEFRPVGDNLYEQVIVRHPSTDPYHSTWYTFPEQDEYPDHDLYSKHPTKPNLWHCEGRADDIIVLSNGEKLNPGSLQGELLSHPDVEGAVVVGQARFEPIALIELRHGDPTSAEEREAFLQSFHPYIDRANDTAPSYGRIGYDHIMFAHRDKPMLRADKGTVKRAATLKVYAAEIDDFYKHLQLSDGSNVVDLDTKDPEALTISLKSMLEGIGDFKGVTDDEDFFSRGMNSLQVMTWVRQIKASVARHDGKAARSVAAKTIYSNPTLEKLALAVHALLDAQAETQGDAQSARINAMKSMVGKFSSDLPAPVARKSLGSNEGVTILLTGSTGGLGSYILDVALSTPSVKRIICLNRSADSEARQRSTHTSRGLVTDWQDRALFLHADLSKPQLGLQDKDYELLQTETTLIIPTDETPLDNQWQVDFNLALTSFTPHVAGTRNLIDLSASSPLRPPIIFTSSIATIGNWNAKHLGEKVPEEPLHDYTISSTTGYGESKYVAQRVLEAAFDKSGVSSTVVRVGQLAGPVVKGGVWNPQDSSNPPSTYASSPLRSRAKTTSPGSPSTSPPNASWRSAFLTSPPPRHHLKHPTKKKEQQRKEKKKNPSCKPSTSQTRLPRPGPIPRSSTPSSRAFPLPPPPIPPPQQKQKQKKPSKSSPTKPGSPPCNPPPPPPPPPTKKMRSRKTRRSRSFPFSRGSPYRRWCC
ncbi:MAG: hypothetical protein Q9228_002325 [Teloschistes exilis]